MRLYVELSKIPFLSKSYAFKFLFVAFVGIHIPLIGILFYVLYEEQSISATFVFIFALLLTLAATVITLYILKRLIYPIEVASKALNDYRLDRTFSHLPIHFNDEAGLLMRNIQETITEHENFIKDKQDLVYLLSHDLRTFAGNPQSLALLILEENPSDTVKEYAELINESSKQQFAYIENFIKLLKDQDQFIKKTSKKNQIIPKELMISVTELVTHSLSKKNIKLVTSIDVDEVFLKIDTKSLIRVLSNLVDNAIKFSHQDSEIKVHIYSESHKIFFKVTDSGIGFDSHQREELFDKFTKIGRLGTSGEASTGIGLYLCKNIIEKHGGTLNAYSDIGKGATFMIVFEL